MDPRFPRYPVRYPQYIQIWQGTPNNPYPMTFMDAPAFDKQLIVNYQGRPNLQGLDIVRGPMMFPVRSPIYYPMTHSIPSPFQQAFLGKNYGYYARRKCF